MRNLYSFRTFLLAALVSLLGGTALAQTQVTDVLTASDFAATNTTYTDFSGVSKTSEAVYAGNSAKTKEGAIQMRSKNSNSGIVSTVSGGTVKSVKITVASGSNTVDVYGSNTAYTSAGDLYATTDNVTQGTLLGSLAASGTITVQGSYKYIGIRSNNGAIYLSSVEVTWEQAASGDNRLDAILTFPQQSLTFDQGSDEARNFEGQEATLRSVSGAPIEGVSIAYSVSADPKDMVVMDDESYFLLLDETLAGKATVTATFAGDNTYKPATASYTITIQPAVADIAAFNALAKGTKAKLTLTDAEVVYAQGNDIFVRDASGAIDFFRTDLGYSTGDILNGTLVATHDIYNGMSELTSPEDVSVTAAGGTAAPEARDATVATASSYTCDLITLSEVDVIKDGNNFYATDGENRVQVYDKFRLGYTVEDGKVYNIKGILIPFNNIYEICPVQAPEEVIQVETPVIAPEKENGQPGLEVSISVENEDLTIYYTLDGTDPAGKTGIRYEEPFLLTKPGGWLVKAVAVDEDGNISEVVEKTYFIVVSFEGVPEITPQREQIFTGTQISISGTNDFQDVYYTTDGSTPDPNATPAVGTLYEAPFTLEAGQHTVTAVFVDKYGNIGFPAVTWEYFVEEQKEAGIAWEQEYVQAEPNGEMVGNTFVNPNQLEVTFSSSDPEVARVDDLGFVYAGTKEGEATVTATFAGTEEYAAAEVSFTLTLAKAAVPSIEAPSIEPAGGEISENASITISWHGNGGAYVIYTTDGTDPKLSQTATKRLMGVTLNVADLVADGRETLTVKAYALGIAQMDTEGESEVVTAEFTILRSQNPDTDEEIDVEVPLDFGYTTLYYGEKNLVVPAGVKVYTMTITEQGNMERGYEYQPGEVIVARTGVVIEGSGVADAVRSRTNRAGESEVVEVFTFQTTEDDSYDPSVMVKNYLHGSDEELTTVGDDPTEEYYFYKLKEDAGTQQKGFFWEADYGAAFTNEPHRAYLAVPKDLVEDVMGLTFSGEKISVPTGLSTLEGAGTAAGTAAYDLQGRRVAAPQRGGIYIVNGRKLLK